MRKTSALAQALWLYFAALAASSNAMAAPKRQMRTIALQQPAQTAKLVSLHVETLPTQTSGITAYLITTGSGTRPFMMLWGRHSPKYVRAGFNRFAMIETDGHRAVLYMRSEKEPGSAWKQVWKSQPEVHQPPALLLDPHGRLHVLYVDQPGRLKHVVFDYARLCIPSLAGTVPTRRG